MKYNDTYSIVDMIERKSQYDKKPNSMPFISFLASTCNRSKYSWTITTLKEDVVLKWHQVLIVYCEQQGTKFF